MKRNPNLPHHLMEDGRVEPSNEGTEIFNAIFYSCAYIREVLEVLGSVQRILDGGGYDEIAGNACQYVKSYGSK